jgi:CheY-like chemotaxis protein
MAPRVLVVQSRPEAARAMSLALADAGLEAVVLLESHRVVDVIETWDPQVVVVDLTLAALDGWYVLAEVGGSARSPFVVARVGDNRDIDRAIALGADAWVDDDVDIVAAAGRLVPSIAA